ncbi:hypothetical protein [Microbacterium sp. Leaf320]|uniref:hypothetical protein n=1 Tax=Microbacterium sp. Leaf320 TaxID=1736334 RepID=UPI0006FD9247|nr:hypothetical protein [Microbacterium sp. Leaf320]KQQ65067.1 hypothetical protein ASF63_13935 [Microbacterium sp. Leaf320]
MAIITHYTQEQRNNQAERIGALFVLPDAGMKMTREGWRMEGWGDEVQLTVELVTFITKEEAEAILNATPIAQDDQ